MERFAAPLRQLCTPNVPRIGFIGQPTGRALASRSWTTASRRADELSAEQAVAYYPRVLEVAPGYARWKRIADLAGRTIPFMRLVALGPAR